MPLCERWVDSLIVRFPSLYLPGFYFFISQDGVLSTSIDLNHLTRESGNRIAVVMVASQGVDDPVAELARRMEPGDRRSVYVVAPDLSVNPESDAQVPVA